MELTLEQVDIIMELTPEQFDIIQYLANTVLPPPRPEPQTPEFIDLGHSAYNMPYDNSPLEDNSPELIAWLNGPEGTSWTKNNFARITYHALLEEWDDLPRGHDYGGTPQASGSNVHMVCTCMTTDDGIPQEVLDADAEELQNIEITYKNTGERLTYIKTMIVDNSSWVMHTPEGNPPQNWGYRINGTVGWVNEYRDMVF